MDWCYRLIVNIFVQAKADYINALRTNNQKQIEELETFFLSDYGQAMSLYNGEKIIELCKELARKKRGIKMISYKGEVKTLAEWAKIKGITPQLIRDRLNRGYSIAQALETPPKWKSEYRERMKNEIQN